MCVCACACEVCAGVYMRACLFVSVFNYSNEIFGNYISPIVVLHLEEFCIV